MVGICVCVHCMPAIEEIETERVFVAECILCFGHFSIFFLLNAGGVFALINIICVIHTFCGKEQKP